MTHPTNQTSEQGGKETAPGSEDCGHDCHHDQRYGFVPEADCPVHDAPPKEASERGEFPQGKENYCPRCYFEDERVVLRKDCPHNATPKKASEGGEKKCTHPTGYCENGFNVCEHCGERWGNGNESEENTLNPASKEVEKEKDLEIEKMILAFRDGYGQLTHIMATIETHYRQREREKVRQVAEQFSTLIPSGRPFDVFINEQGDSGRTFNLIEGLKKLINQLLSEHSDKDQPQ